MATEDATIAVNFLMNADTLLEHWQGHRRLTRKTIAVFPDEKLFTFSIGGMRSFGEMAGELLSMALPVVDGLTTGSWTSFDYTRPETKDGVLQAWDVQTEQLNDRFLKIPPEEFTKLHKAFGQWEMPGIALVQYAIDNEIHHRGEGFVYLRALGVEPPAFWDRY